MAATKGRSIDQALRGAKEIPIPYTIAVRGYGAVVVAIIDQLGNSLASDAKSHSPEQFKWFLVYQQPTDPTTTNETEFVQSLIKQTTVYLVCKGFRWRGFAQINGEIPEQVRQRYEERARLMCATPLHIDANTIASTGIVKCIGGSLDDDINDILSSIAKLPVKHHVDVGYIKIIELALKHMRQPHRKRVS